MIIKGVLFACLALVAYANEDMVDLGLCNDNSLSYRLPIPRSECRLFVACVGFKQVGISKCPPFTVFDFDKQRCDYKNNVTCNTDDANFNVDVRCFKPVENTNCKDFYFCDMNNYEASSSCSDSLYFSPTYLTCVHEYGLINDDYEICGIPNPCPDGDCDQPNQ